MTGRRPHTTPDRRSSRAGTRSRRTGGYTVLPVAHRDMRVTAIDHLVLYVADVEATCAFYADTLDVASVETSPKGRTSLSFGSTKLNLHPASEPYEPHAAAPTPGAADFCLVVDEPIEAVERRLAAADVAIVEGPADKRGARGPMDSIYVRDPDGNLVELANYGS